jgi:hypothetical protein
MSQAGQSELFVVERENGEWINTNDGTDYSVYATLIEAQDALDGEADCCEEEEATYKIVRFVREVTR